MRGPPADVAAGPSERRRAACLANLPQIVSGTYLPDAGPRCLLAHPGMTPAEADAAIAARFPGFNERQRANQFREFVEPLIASFRRIGADVPFLVVLGDNTRLPPVPAFCRTRPIAHRQNAILGRLGWVRHFAPVAKVDGLDVPWREKADRLVWRGATTGRFVDRPGAAERGSRSFVPAVLQRTDDRRIDIGFSEVVQLTAQTTAVPLPLVKRCVRPTLTVAEQLRARYLLALEGNEVASGLRWMLYSNSVVLMPRPTYESWACEGLLEPFVHYVPVRPNLSDLEQVLGWCREHDDACEAIARNGRAFMAPFWDEPADLALADAISTEYARRIRIVTG
ncbi:glycosyl transferase family 90 [Acuticoccus sp.]|uniref:glycosyl transferase family 90 n=1 Tax=Acuticoccus sp. TaxID=1904378 RepID=UPI003B5229B5